MNRFDYYKDVYFRELDKKDAINNSLSLPIGLITALIASVFYLLSNFDYKFSYPISGVFLLLVIIAVIQLAISIYHLIKSYNGFPDKYNYLLLPDNDVVEKYYADLKAYYATTGVDNSDKDLEEYLVKEMAKNTGENQRNNLRKTKFSYNCEKFLIRSLIFIIISLPFFVYDYSMKTDKKEATEVHITNPSVSDIHLDSKENRNFIINLLKDSAFMAQLHYLQIRKPMAPPSQILTEGEDPRPLAPARSARRK
ncbi:MAG: hypothetical protein QM731_13265 [Chitinophagaceae bacterium]